MELQRKTNGRGETFRLYADQTAYGSIYTIEVARLTTEEGTTWWDRVPSAPITTDLNKITETFNTLTSKP